MTAPGLVVKKKLDLTIIAMALIMMVLLSIGGWLLTGIFVLRPMDFLQWLHLPSWFGLAILILTISWCLGD
ncbi:MAG: hypothetical protein F6K35_14615 [Okeania sp. SIO2H7]|nr:hypothetical protein [Okeania sp. SIO2H7]